ncbi:hypothetical protein F5Y01DRAFT_95266 [Xylaria sp. FL0043]|nr:hypothetical protein F5Y01DRAFT_95266 [Xylaria sp. FL0043]
MGWMASALTESLPFVMGGNNIRYGLTLAFSTWLSVGNLVLLVKVKREWCFGVFLLTHHYGVHGVVLFQLFCLPFSLCPFRRVMGRLGLVQTYLYYKKEADNMIGYSVRPAYTRY